MACFLRRGRAVWRSDYAVALLVFAHVFGPSAAERITAAEPLLPVSRFLQKYCVECHGGEDPKGGLSLAEVQTKNDVIRRRESWEDLLDLVEGQVMPPAKSRQPAADEIDAFVRAIRAVFDEFDRSAAPDPGRVTMRRLNKAEYNNTIRDLFFGFDARPAEDFPNDDVGHGFDNIGDVLSMSPVLMERYLTAADFISQQVLPVSPPISAGHRVRGQATRPPKPAALRRERFRTVTTAPGAPSHMACPLYVNSVLTAPDEYLLSVDCYAERDGKLPVQVALFTGGASVDTPSTDTEIESLFGHGIEDLRPLRILGVFEVTARDPDRLQTISVGFSTQASARLFGLALIQTRDEPPSTLHVEAIGLEGPLDARPHPMRRLIECPADATHDEKTRVIVERFASRAYRRPVAPAELDRLIQIVADCEAQGEPWEAGLQLVVRTVLSSPKFLFRTELNPEESSSEPVPLDEFQLASRLSYFLWSSMPDDELFALAARNELSANLDAQVRRMLRDPKSRGLVEQFGMQWLQLDRLKSHVPDPALFPGFNESVRFAMLHETRLFLEAVIREDRDIVELIDADFTFVNRTLAEFYGIPDPTESSAARRKAPEQNAGSHTEWRRITLSDGIRGGLLTHASILTANSNPTRTSPVKRGKWVLEQLLGKSPPPPPPDVPELEQQQDRLTGTLRQQMEQHRMNPACASCHTEMDQIGFAFENFDAVGVFRTTEKGEPIDSTGVLPGGRAFRGPAELRAVLAENRVQFTRCLTEKLLTFALGRGLEYYDARAVNRIVTELGAGGDKFSTLCAAIARSEPFRLRRGTAFVRAGVE